MINSIVPVKRRAWADTAAAALDLPAGLLKILVGGGVPACKCHSAQSWPSLPCLFRSVHDPYETMCDQLGWAMDWGFQRRQSVRTENKGAFGAIWRVPGIRPGIAQPIGTCAYLRYCLGCCIHHGARYGKSTLSGCLVLVIQSTLV